MILIAFDLILSASLIWLAYRILISENFFTSVVLFLSFGLFMAMVWVRLRAPDVALAEASIGAGLTGALFLSALRGVVGGKRRERRVDRDK
ncbi:MAG: DUF4040 domain-containing protein [Desulfobulbaceae bacterium]|nr:DUF4040 domain-containing protein [Desulfobulbaceae bacterium]